MTEKKDTIRIFHIETQRWVDVPRSDFNAFQHEVQGKIVSGADELLKVIRSVQQKAEPFVPRVGFLFAVAENGAFGKGHTLPWPKGRGDLPRFKALTQNCVLLAGSYTAHFCLPDLPGRDVLVFTRNLLQRNLSHEVTSLGEAIGYASSARKNLWIIGGATLLRMFKADKRVTHASVTIVHGNYEADVTLDLNAWLDGWVRAENGTDISTPGLTFLDLIRDPETVG